MQNALWIIISTMLILGITLLINFLVTRAANRKKAMNLSDWQVGGRDLPFYVVIGTQLATAMGGGVLVGHVGVAYNDGMSTLTYGAISASTLIVIMFISNWLRKNNFVTISDVIQSFRGPHPVISILAGLMSLVVPFGWAISQFASFGKLYTAMTGIPPYVLIIFLGIITVFFVMPAGLKTVAWTDFIFSIFIVISAVFVVGYTLNMADGYSTVTETLPEITAFPEGLFSIGAFTVFTWILSLLPGGVTNQMYFQRVCAIREPKRIVPTMIISAILVFMTNVFSYFMGVSIHTVNPNLKGEMATGWLLEQLPLWFLLIFAGLITCTILSTISSGVQTVVVNFTRDCLPVISPNSTQDENRVLRLSRVLSVVVIAICVALSILYPSVLDWLVYTYSYSAASLFMPVYGSLMLKKTNLVTNQGIIASMICGTVGCMIAQILSTKIPFVAYGLLASVISYLVVGYLTRTSTTHETTAEA